MTKRPEPAADIDAATVEKVWSCWLDGDSVNRIVEYNDIQRRIVNYLLTEEPPQKIKDDLRYQLGGRGLWISVQKNTEHAPWSLVFAIIPRRITGTKFVKGIRAIRRDFREAYPGSDLSLSVLEGIELDAVRTYVDEKKYPCWRIDEEGGIKRMYSVLAEASDDIPKLS